MTRWLALPRDAGGLSRSCSECDWAPSRVFTTHQASAQPSRVGCRGVTLALRRQVASI